MPDKTESHPSAAIGRGQSSAPAVNKIETDHHIIHLEPRISATKLAEYVIADPSRQETIAKQAKHGSKAVILHYTRVRNAFGEALTPEGLDPQVLIQRAEQAEAARSDNTWQQDDNVRSGEALRRLATIGPELACKNVTHIHRPSDGWPALNISGVRVSIQPELVFAVEHRGITKIGAIILNTGKSESLSLARTNGRATVGDYLTVLVYLMLEDKLSAWGVPLHTRCYAVDVFRDTIYTAPAAHRTMLKHIEAACRMIALRWDGIPSELNSEEVVDA
jgi:hypothetical protein